MRLIKRFCICIVTLLAVALSGSVVSFATEQTWSVSFDAGGGSGEMEAVTVGAGEMLILPECGFEAPENKTFERWDLGEPGEEVEIIEDTVVTAQWMEEEEPIRVGWVDDNGEWYFYEQDGSMRQNSWAVDSTGWCWLDENGRITKDQWIVYNDDWYYLKPDGYMAVNEWAKDSAGWCWLSGSGRMAKDKWITYKNTWYYLKPNGHMAAGEWLKYKNVWYYLKPNGHMASGEWLKYKNVWYYLKPNGHMAAGEWLKYKNAWYYLKQNGHMASREWARDSRGWCWLLPGGKAARGQWILDGKEWYYITSDLHMAANTWVADSSDNCYLNASGKIAYRTRKQAGAVVYRPAPNRQNGKLVVLDPGHSRVLPSGTEPVGPGSSTMKAKTSSGTQGVSTGINEYEMNMTISQALRTELLSRGYAVALTHETNDQAISNIARTQIANNLKADAYLRIHCNSVDSSSKRGAMSVTITSSNPWKKSMYSVCSKLAESVLSEYCKATGLSRDGIWYTDSMTGNNWADVPCILFEMGYMSNSTEDRWMANASNQKLMVKGLANGIDKFFK